MNRRALASTTALSLVALAGCSTLAGLVTPANVATVEQVIADIQAVMPYVSGIASVIGILVPGVSSAVTIVEDGLTAASNVFATLVSTMTVAAAQPLVGQIAASIQGALTAAKQIAASLPSASAAQVNNLLAEADTILVSLTTFAGTAPVASARIIGVLKTPVHVFVRPVG